MVTAMEGNQKLLGLARRRQLNNIAGDATQQNRLQRTTTSITPAYNRLTQSRRSSGLVQRAQVRDASFRQANRDFEQRQQNTLYNRSRDAAQDKRDRENTLYNRSRDAAQDSRFNRLQNRIEGIDRYNRGRDQIDDKRAAEDSRFKRTVNQANLDRVNLGNEAARRKLNAPAKIDFEKTFKENWIYREAKKNGIDTSRFFDEDGEPTQEAREYRDSVQTEFNTNGGDIQKALQVGGSGTLLARQGATSNRINELEQLGGDLTGEQRIELDANKKALADNARSLFKVNPTGRNPYREQQTQKVTSELQSVFSDIGDIEKATPQDLSLKAEQIKSYLAQEGIELGDINIGRGKEKLDKLLGAHDPKMNELSKKVNELQVRLENRKKEEAEYDDTNGFDISGLAFDDGTENLLQRAQSELDEYLKTKGLFEESSFKRFRNKYSGIAKKRREERQSRLGR